MVAGALSVGIGFGLQNIVNNFVSGLILLFERPIKSGDFVTVGGVEGTVKQISIRSTEIETLDRQNVIVPNSELVSQQVTNWVLHDPHGRLQLLVGVAYGSDVDKVRDVLLDVAQGHPQVLTDGISSPRPKVLFREFGDSALIFELRVWIRQIRRRFDVSSEINFGIERAFREAGIEIPFPQRDLHVKSWSDGARPSGPGEGGGA
jgi:small-conductance mechanosensitive channel